MPRPLALWRGALAGGAAMLTFHQPAVALLRQGGLYPVEPFILAPAGTGLPTVLQGALFSAAWGALFALLWRGRPPLLPAAMLYCATVPLAFLFLVLAAWNAQPIAYGMAPAEVARVSLTHLVWGAGIWVWVRALERR